MRKLFILSIAIFTIGCQKEKNQYKTVNYHCYSEKGGATFKCVNENDVWETFTIKGNFDLTVRMNPDNMHWISSITSNGADSLFIGAECEGKYRNNGYRNTIGNANLSISLNELR